MPEVRARKLRLVQPNEDDDRRRINALRRESASCTVSRGDGKTHDERDEAAFEEIVEASHQGVEPRVIGLELDLRDDLVCDDSRLPPSALSVSVHKRSTAKTHTHSRQ